MRLVRAALAALAIACAPLPAIEGGTPARAHGEADWIMRGQHRNAAGEWCCGEDDCVTVAGVRTVALPEPGYRLPGGEFVPQAEAQPSPDGRFWRCRRPDGSRRCFFAPPPGS
jgi:hypothetical protein